MRPFHLVLKDLFDDLGGVDEAAKLFALSRGRVYKYVQPESAEGEDIPLRHFRTLLAEAGKRANQLELQLHVDELLNDHFNGLAGRRAVAIERLQHQVEEMMELVRGNGNGNGKPKKPPCPYCSKPLTQRGVLDGQAVYMCLSCRGMGAEYKEMAIDSK